MSNNKKVVTMLANGMKFLGDVPSNFKVKHTWHSHGKRATIRVNSKWDVESGKDGQLWPEGKRKFVLNARPIIQRVVHQYLDGRVSINTGDIWDIELNKNQKESKYITVLNNK